MARNIDIKLGSKYDGSGVSAAMKSLKRLVHGATDIKSAFEMGFGAIRKAFGALKTIVGSAFKFETQTTQFKTLIGSIDEAKAHMADLKALGDTPPFNLDQFAAASRQLMVMTDGVLGYKKSLELIGDAAAATGKPIEEMGHAVGRLYSFIRDGQPLSRAVMELRNMGVLTPEVAQKLQDMQKAGAKTTELWEEVEKALGRYNGAMKATEQTGEGMIGAIESRWDSVVRTFGQALEEEAKGGLKSVLDQMKEIEEDGTLAVWAEKVKSAVAAVANAFKSLAPVVSGVWKTIVGTFDAVGSELGRFAGAISMGNFADAFGGIGTETARAFTEAFDLDGQGAVKDAETKAKAMAAAAEKAAKEKAAEAERAAAEEARKVAALEEGQRKIEERAAAEQAEKLAEIHKKALEERDSLEREYAAKRDEYVRENAEHAGRYAVGVSETGEVIYKTITEAAAKASAAAKAAEFDASEVGKTYLKDLQALSELVGQTAAEKPDEPEKQEKPEKPGKPKEALEQVKAAQKTSAELRAIKLQEIADRKRAEEKAKADELKFQREAIAKRIELMRQANAKELDEIDKRIAAEREKEKKWEEEAKGMREAAAGGGKGLGDFFRNRRDQRDERREARNRAVALARVNREIADLERRDVRGRGLNDAQRERLKELRDFVNRQDPKNNPAAKAAAELEKKKLAAIEKTQKAIDDLKTSIEQRTVL